MNDSFRRRVAVAAALLFGFYTLALVAAGALLAIAIVPYIVDGPTNLWITIACLLTGFAILRAIIPRRVGFDEPGPLLTEEDQPELHALVREVAQEAGQEVPAEIYLDYDVNAAVTEAGGVMGIGSRRVLIVGLPLFEALTVAQLRAVIAHEFGHYHGGDTKLGPFFFRTHDAVARTIEALEKRGSWLRHPFIWYGRFFLRRSAAIKQRQEFTADRLSAQIAGRSVAESTLRTVSGQGEAFDAYWHSEFVPVVESDARPPLLEGFMRFKSVPAVQEGIAEAVADHERAEDADPYSTHPSLRERLEALADAPGPDTQDDGRRALTLLSAPEEFERMMVDHLLTEEARRTLPEVGWDAVPEKVMVPAWRDSVAEHQHELAALTAADLADELPRAERFAISVFGAEELPPEIEEQREIGRSVLGTGLAVALHDSGWEIHALPGLPVTARRGGHEIEVFRDVRAVMEGELDAAEWRRRCDEWGIGALRLGSEQAAAASEGEAVAVAG